MLRQLIAHRLLSFSLRRPTGRRIRRLLVAAVLAAFLLEALRVMAWTNRHEIIPGKVYRTAQLNAAGLDEYVRSHGIKTVINLRGYCPGEQAPWYKEEIRVTHALGVSQEDITFSANRLPPPTELKRLIEVLDRTEYPIVIHCKRGADRTGMTAAIIMLLFTDATLDRARRQLWPRYGHFRFGRTAAMDDFFDRYEKWLNGRDHASVLFREWAANHYSPGPARGTLVPTDGETQRKARANEWTTIQLTATNTSGENWELRPGNYAGVHVQFTVQTPEGEQYHVGQAGLFRKTVPPGESLVLSLAVPPIAVPGKYVIRADLIDATEAAVPIRQTGFYQFGSDPLLINLDVK